VAFPAYAELHKLGKPVAPFFLRTMRTVLLVTAPIYVGLALTADAAVLTLFGPKWSEMAPIAAGLALAMPAMALQIVCSPATNAMGSPRIYVITSAIGAVIYPAVFLIGIAYGPMGLVYAWWVAAPTLLLATLLLTLPAVGLTFGKLIAELLPVGLACAVMALAVTALKAAIGSAAPPMQLLLVVPFGALAYGATIWLGWPHFCGKHGRCCAKEKKRRSLPEIIGPHLVARRRRGKVALAPQGEDAAVGEDA